MKGNTKATICVLSIAAIFALSVLAIGVMAKPPKPDPVPTEPFGKFVAASGPQSVLTSDSYIRLFNWVSGEFNHTWSAAASKKGMIGDVDNDGEKEVVAQYVTSVTKRGKTTYTYYLRVWNDGDASDSPSITVQMPTGTCSAEVGDVDKDGSKELVISSVDGQGSAEVWSCNETACTNEKTISSLGFMGVTVADTDNDGYSETMMGQGTGDYSNQPVIADYSNGAYSIIPLPMATKKAVDEVSVGDIDGDGKNELFGVSVDGNAHVWKYSNGQYSEIWTKAVGDYGMNTEIADVNGDGKNEIAFTQFYAQKLVLYKYDGNNVWSELAKYDNANGGVGDAMVSADVDSDGDAELVVANQVWDWDGSAMKNIQDLNPNKDSLRDVSMA